MVENRYRKSSSIGRTKSQNLNVFRLVWQLSLLNPLEPGVKSIMKMCVIFVCSPTSVIAIPSLKFTSHMYAFVIEATIGSYNGLSPVIVSWAIRNKFRWKLNQIITMFIQQRHLQNVVCKMSAIFSANSITRNKCGFNQLAKLCTSVKFMKLFSIVIRTIQLSVRSKGHYSPEGRLLAYIFNVRSAFRTCLLWQIEI